MKPIDIQMGEYAQHAVILLAAAMALLLKAGAPNRGDAVDVPVAVQCMKFAFAHCGGCQAVEGRGISFTHRSPS